MRTLAFPIRGEFITLDRLLKATGLADSGGQARMMIVDGLVEVDGAPESRETAKIRPGQGVTLGEVRIQIQGEA